LTQLISKNFDKIQQLWSALKRESEIESTLIIVEGRKDRVSLKNFGITRNVIHFQGRNTNEICDYAVKFHKVIILTDFDKAGQKLAKNIQHNLHSRGINIDLTYYFRLKFYFKKVSKDIESLFKIFQKIEEVKSKNKKP